MIHRGYAGRFFMVLSLLAAVSFFQASLGGAAAVYEEESTGDVLYVKGLISEVLVDTMQISVRPPKEKRVTINIGPDTELEGFRSIDELSRKQQVKVWYTAGGGENMAVKIVKIMELGC